MSNATDRSALIAEIQKHVENSAAWRLDDAQGISDSVELACDAEGLLARALEALSCSASSETPQLPKCHHQHWTADRHRPGVRRCYLCGASEPAQGSCLICGHDKPFAVCHESGLVGVCATCRDRAHVAASSETQEERPDDYRAYAVRHLRMAIEKDGDAPMSAQMHEEQAAHALRLSRIPKVGETLAYLEAQSSPVPHEVKDESRCAVCAWPLAETIEKGCVRGNCSMRPHPNRFYDAERAEREYGIAVGLVGGNHVFLFDKPEGLVRDVE